LANASFSSVSTTDSGQSLTGTLFKLILTIEFVMGCQQYISPSQFTQFLRSNIVTSKNKKGRIPRNGKSGLCFQFSADNAAILPPVMSARRPARGATSLF
jgi:hypothetical protein